MSNQNKPVVRIAPNNQVFDLPVIVAIEEAYAAEMGATSVGPEARRTPAKPKRTVARKAPRKTSKKAQNKTTKRKKR